MARHDREDPHSLEEQLAWLDAIKENEEAPTGSVTATLDDTVVSPYPKDPWGAIPAEADPSPPPLFRAAADSAYPAAGPAETAPGGVPAEEPAPEDADAAEWREASSNPRGAFSTPEPPAPTPSAFGESRGAFGTEPAFGTESAFGSESTSAFTTDPKGAFAIPEPGPSATTGSGTTTSPGDDAFLAPLKPLPRQEPTRQETTDPSLARSAATAAQEQHQPAAPKAPSRGLFEEPLREQTPSAPASDPMPPAASAEERGHLTDPPATEYGRGRGAAHEDVTREDLSREARKVRESLGEPVTRSWEPAQPEAGEPDWGRTSPRLDPPQQPAPLPAAQAEPTTPAVPAVPKPAAPALPQQPAVPQQVEPEREPYQARRRQAPPPQQAFGAPARQGGGRKAAKADLVGAGGTPTADSLDPESLLRGRRNGPSRGWRKLVYKASAGMIKPGESPEVRRRRELIARARTPVATGHHRVAVLSLKGGVGKTTSTVGLGATLAQVRGDRVIAVDANPDRGTLSDKVVLETSATVRDLLNERGQIKRYVDIRAFTSQAPSRLEILASDRDPSVSEAFSAADYQAVAQVLENFYSICITDCGTGLLHSAMSGVLGLADQLVLVSSPSVDGARAASATLDWLEAHHYGELVRAATVVLCSVRPRSKSAVDIDKLEAHFAARCRAVIRIPYDPHLEEGAEIDLDRLQEATRDAYLKLAACVGDGFAAPALQPR
ncbi:MinD-like ATPase involved in chromosome partitioning or flagellar assembly [Thermocatellispora tengchongensis]|uniref:MinD-like ATPase involved in chromosome partitioning or flagellar assembly n=1 Tax=Thermocatellispora tengchongensis TaxID=1073253 RepID=A0A840NT73_9ACTN|nr:AAA family ATPase [Thermocatellispora tengchongensis]MBB5130778.1 MinD-like ATPase involved in chromosome partitioning or flagellar assembly [Thermocatellispora tengchongensis]